MKIQTLKSLIEIEFERADNHYKLKSAIERLLDLYESDNISENNNTCSMPFSSDVDYGTFSSGNPFGVKI